MIQLGSAHGEVTIGVGDAQRSLASLGNSMRAVQGSMARGWGGLQNAVGVGLKAAAYAGAAGIAALGAGLVASVKVAASFESQMNILTVAARSSGTAMEDLSKAAIRVGGDAELVGISASEAADAMTNFYKAGLTTNEIFSDMQGYLAGTVPLTGALRAAIDLAAASELDLAAASDVVSIAMATFGLGAADAARIADVLVQAADASLASVSGLAEGMKTVGVNVGGLEDTATALALLSTRGIQGAEAGTALKSMMINMRRPTDAVVGALNELNVSLYDLDGNARLLPDVLADLEQALYGTNAVTTTSSNLTAEQAERMEYLEKKIGSTNRSIADYEAGIAGANLTDDKRIKKLEELNSVLDAAQGEYAGLAKIGGTTATAMVKLTQKQRDNYIVTLAGSYGQAALNVLLREGAAGWEEMEKAMAAAATAQEVAEVRTRGFEAAIEQLKGAVETFMIVIGTPLIQKILTPLAQKFGAIITKVTELAQTIRDAGFTDLFAVFEDGSSYLGRFLEIMGMAEEPAQKLAASILGFIDATGKIFGTIGDAIASFISWKDVLIAFGIVAGTVAGSFLLAWAPVVAMAAGLILAVALLRNAWESDFGGIRTKTTEAIEGMRPAFEKLRAWLSVEIPAAAKETGDGMQKEFIKIRIQAALLVLELEKTFADADMVIDWTKIRIPIDDKTDFVVEWTELWEEIKGVTTRGLINIPAQIGLGLVYVRGAWQYANSLVTGDWEGAWEGWQKAAGAGLDSILRMVDVWSPEMAARMKKAADTLSLIMGVEWAVLSGLFEQYVIQPLRLGLGETLPATLASFGTAWGSGWTAAGTAVTTAVASISTAYESLRVWLHETLPAALATLGQAWKTGWAAVQQAVTAAWGGILGAFSAMKDWLANLLPNALAAFQDWLGGFSLPNPFAALTGAIDSIRSGVEGLQGTIQRFVDWIDGIRIRNPFSGFTFPRIGGNALGTDFWRGGLTLVGERGPELIELPRGSRVYDAQESQRMGGGGATTINNTYYVADNLDIEAVAYRVMQVIQKRGR